MTQCGKNSYQHIRDEGNNSGERSQRLQSHRSRHATCPKSDEHGEEGMGNNMGQRGDPDDA